MAAKTAHLALRRIGAVPESRAVQARLMAGLALAAVGGVLGTALLVSGGNQRQADALERIWAPPPGQACGAAEQLAAGDGSSAAECAPARQTPQATAERARPGAESGAAGPAAAAPPEAAAQRRQASRAPTYIRIRKPQPRPEPPAWLELQTLRGRL